MSVVYRQPGRVYGCHNRPPYLEVVTTHHINPKTGEPVETSWPFKGSPLCSYTHTDLGRADARCTGCTWRPA